MQIQRSALISGRIRNRSIAAKDKERRCNDRDAGQNRDHGAKRVSAPSTYLRPVCARGSALKLRGYRRERLSQRFVPPTSIWQTNNSRRDSRVLLAGYWSGACQGRREAGVWLPALGRLWGQNSGHAAHNQAMTDEVRRSGCPQRCVLPGCWAAI